MIPLTQNPIFAGRLSPVILRPRNTKNMKRRRLSPPVLWKKTKKKKSSSSSIIEITKGSFDVTVQKSSTAVTHDGGRNVLSSWVKSQLLGKGSYGSVYLATSKNEKEKTERAIKTTELSRASSLMDEGRILIRLESPFVVRCYGDEIACDENDHHLLGDCMKYNLILEYCSGLSIADLIEDNHGGLFESDVKLFARDVLCGLSYIHDRNIIHCDIKPDNLLLCPTDHRLRPNGYIVEV